jgi:hypothetical protein
MNILADRIIRWGFYALFPGFFAYHFLVAKEWLPPVLGGYSSAMAALLVLPLGALFVLRVLNDPARRTGMDWAFLAFVGYYAAVMLAHLALGSRSEAATEHFGVMVQFLSLYFCLRLLQLGDRSLARWLVVFLLAMTATIAINAEEGLFVVAAYDLLLSGSHFATYQAYAFIFLVTQLLVLAPIQRLTWRILVYCIAAPTLFLNGARTEFVGFLLLALVLEFLLSRHKLLMIGAAALVVLLAWAALPILAELYPESRTVFLFLDYSQDISANQRAQMLGEGLQSIADNPWLGALGSHAPGEHIHNGLSAWVDLGLLGFVLYGLLILLPTLDLCVYRIRQLHDPQVRLAFSLLFLVALFAITSKHYTHQLLPLALAAYARVRSGEPRGATAPVQAAIALG